MTAPNPEPMPFVTRYSPAGCLKGAALLTIALAALSGLALFLGVRGLRKEHRERLDALLAQGYTQRTGDVVRIESTLKEPVILYAREVSVAEGSQAGLAIFSQSAELRGTFAGPVFFAGQTLVVHRASTLLDSLELRARNVRIEGTLQEEPTGTWQFMRREPLDPAPPPEAGEPAL